MALPRSKYVQEGEEGVYHCLTRCVRGAFLFGFDAESDRDFSHRKEWLVNMMRHLATIFAIEVCAYAVLGTHYHIILRVLPDLVAMWSDRDVVIRWLKLFPKHRDKNGVGLPPTEQEIRALTDNADRIVELRKRLCSLSWFMGRLNESIARAANKEDGVKGRFWESRFKCQALLDLAATASCMVYVDLNAIRAGLAATPEESDFTSIQERIRAWQKEHMTAAAAAKAGSEEIQPAPSASPLGSWLCPIGSESGRRGILDMTAEEYFDLLDKSGRMLRSDKRGAIDADLAPILQRIGVQPDAWLDTVTRFGSRFRVAAGQVTSLRKFADRIGRRWLQGVSLARASFGA